MIEFLIFGLLTLAVLSLWLLIEGRKNPKFLIWFIPLLLILTTSIYITYTSILGLPKVATPEKGLYLKHYIDEPDWIYLWVVGKENIPKNFQIPYSRESHKALEGVKGKSDEGKFMVLGNKMEEQGSGSEEGEDENSAGGYTIGGDVSFFEWDHESFMRPKE